MKPSDSVTNSKANVKKPPIATQEVSQWLLNKLPHKIMWMNEVGDIIYTNKMFCERLGYQPSDTTRLKIYDVNPYSTNKSWKAHWDLMQQEKQLNFKAIHQTKNGVHYDVEVFARLFENNNQTIICAVVSDISQSSFYRNLLNHAERITNVGGWKLNLQEGTLIATNQALKIFNVEDKEALLPGNVIKYFKETGQLKKLLRNAIRFGTKYDEVFTLMTSNDTPKYIRCVTEPMMKNQKVYKIIGTYQDVTEEVNKRKKLTSFKDIIDNAQDLIYFRDKKHNFKYINNAFVKYLRKTVPKFSKISEAEVIGKNEHDFWPNRSVEDMDALWHRVQEEECIDTSIKYQSDDKTLFFQSTVLKIIHKDEPLLCGITRDVTAIVENEQQLKHTLSELSELKDELEIDNQYLREEINSKINFENIVCVSHSYQKVLEKVTQVAVTDATVLITGESGTGKELLAGAVHLNSKRKDKTLIKVNCATLPKELIESELFGHKKGAFTGAVSDKIGKFSLADGGTIFLDEIGEVPIDLQAKLLRVLQEGEFDPLGATKTQKVNVRIIAATNRNLEDMVEKGTFREDLYYRLNVFPIHNISLRKRKEDIPMLAQFFLEKYTAKAGKCFKRISKKAIAMLMEYNFPGNIRELENLIERAVIIENGTTLQAGSWMPKPKLNLLSNEFKSFEEAQKDYIIKVLEHTNWRVSGPRGAATILNMNDKTLFAKMKKLGIEKQFGLKKL